MKDKIIRAYYDTHTVDKINELIDIVNRHEEEITDLKDVLTPAEIKFAPPFKPWPQIGDTIFRFNSRGEIIGQPWHDTAKQQKIRDFLGIYKTREEAEKALEFYRDTGRFYEDGIV